MTGRISISSEESWFAGAMAGAADHGHGRRLLLGVCGLWGDAGGVMVEPVELC